MSYTKLYGISNAIYLWVSLIATAFLLAIIAAYYASFFIPPLSLLTPLFLASVYMAFVFKKAPSSSKEKMIKTASILWTLLMYTILGISPYIS